MSTMEATVLLNPRCGQTLGLSPDELGRRLVEAVAEGGIAAKVRLTPGPELVAAARAALGRCDLVIAAGGDGTASAVAGALVGSETLFAALPLGTFNHFAKDLGQPDDWAAAAAALGQGEPRDIDVGEVNGRVFLNNSSVGAYPRLVRRRDQHRKRWGLPKALAMALATVEFAGRMPLARVKLEFDGESVFRWVTPFVLVGNNEFTGRPLSGRWRAQLNGGKLWVYTLPTLSVWRTAQAMLAASFRGLRDLRGCQARPASQLTVSTWRRRPPVAFDGEVARMPSPLRYRIRPGALRVLAPPPPSGKDEDNR
jgi:diacylglycerol kinase family enzyme